MSAASEPVYDAIVIGAGPTGLACAIEIQQRDLKVILLEKGCLTNSLYHYPPHMTFLTTPELLEIVNLPMTSFNENPNRTEAVKYYRRATQYFRLAGRQYERARRSEAQDREFHGWRSP